MKYTDNALNILTANKFKGIGRATIVNNLKGNERIEDIVSLINSKSKENDITIDDFKECKQQILNKIEQFEDAYDGIVAIRDKNFPKYRGNVKDSQKPIFLFYKGDLSLLNIEKIKISVIGLLNPEEEIIEREKKLVAELVKKNATIVSGLAFGCDSVAHIQALEGGKTIAILPSPIHNILPAKNRELAFKIVEEGGLLISEYYEDISNNMELTTRYVERDRLQALFCDTIILIASYAQNSASRWSELYGKKLDSGARLAMGYAKNYGIPRALMYDEKKDFNNPMFDLNRDLIKENDTTILSPTTIKKLINNISKNKNNSSIQTSLFS